jgi:peptidoglycan biosynthesis protein MviN/MurJ (putative lipid II flippase)
MKIPAPAQTANRRIARAAATVMAAFIISSLVGLASGVVIAHAFSTTANMDSLNSVNRITELLFNLVAGGLVFHSVVEIVSRAFYALHDTHTSVLVGVDVDWIVNRGQGRKIR